MCLGSLDRSLIWWFHNVMMPFSGSLPGWIRQTVYLADTDTRTYMRLMMSYFTPRFSCNYSNIVNWQDSGTFEVVCAVTTCKNVHYNMWKLDVRSQLWFCPRNQLTWLLAHDSFKVVKSFQFSVQLGEPWSTGHFQSASTTTRLTCEWGRTPRVAYGFR